LIEGHLRATSSDKHDLYMLAQGVTTDSTLGKWFTSAFKLWRLIFLGHKQNG